MGQPICGIVESMTHENGLEMIEYTSTEGNITDGANNGYTNTGNQTVGGFLLILTSGARDLFNGTG